MRAYIIAGFVFIVLTTVSVALCFLGLGGNALWYIESKGCPENVLSCPATYTIAPMWVHFAFFVLFLVLSGAFSLLAFVFAHE